MELDKKKIDAELIAREKRDFEGILMTAIMCVLAERLGLPRNTLITEIKSLYRTLMRLQISKEYADGRLSS